ncbi:DUF6435 family protein [Pseudohalioglobus lutimaris]|uniref:Lacal_2735 family protein n=1 Tax=Pseudohalioglobus lutimaris TaxID=1737061 RepID=A0A2N5X4B6_9GAMM|nr:DUF6435 family protein [Pseudohalioglobus lutimaris]PLW69336.1 hypothetical protein C0039_07320 [Pseudohalioglobus lutimaris]
MFGLLKKSPAKKLQAEFEKLSTQAFEAQRNGNIRLYSSLTAEAEEVREKIRELEAAGGA